jgi:predicted enzyme related to lactoylglutathione lyase
MTTHIRHLSIDCLDPYPLAQFWSAVLERPMDGDDRPGDEECSVGLPEGNFPARILFIRVPEGKVAKNRLHLDIGPVDRTLLEEVERIKALGATVAADRRGPRGIGWFVMLDPAGNEFCVESSGAEIAAVRAALAAEQ